MSKFRFRTIASAAAFVGAWSFSTCGSAAVGDIWGGGASVIAPYWRQMLDCLAEPTALITKATPPTFTTEAAFDYLGKAGKGAQNCATTHLNTSFTAYYISATSGTGILAQFSHDPTLWGFVNAGDTQYAPSVQYNLSETPLSSTDVFTYDNGGTETQGSSHVVVVAPGVTPSAGQYGNPKQLYGPLVQFPVSIDPLAIAYNPIYEKTSAGPSYRFNIQYPRANGSGGLRLSAATYCKIFNGQITNWNNPALTAANGNVSLEDPNDPTPAASWSVPLQIVGRGDSAGTTSTLTRHLATICSAYISGNNYSTGTSTLPAVMQGPAYNSTNANYPAVAGETLGRFTLATGNSGVAKYVAFTATPGGSNPSTIIQGRIAYLGNDYVLPNVGATQSNTYNLASATLQNSLKQWVAPTPTSAAAAFASILPPQSNASGGYAPSNTANGLRVNPQDWVQSSTPTALLANPVHTNSYPIVGTANFLGYTCYQTSQETASTLSALNYLYKALIATDPKNGILGSAGVSPLPVAWRTAILGTFINNSNGLGLNVETAGARGACSVSGVSGG